VDIDYHRAREIRDMATVQVVQRSVVARVRWTRNAVENVWRAFRSAPRALLYPLLGQILAVATSAALLSALGLPDTADGKAGFLVVAYSAVVVFALFGYLLGGSFDEARRLSITDPLTGLYNRRHFGQRLSEEAKRAHRYGHPSSVLCVDVDRLKAINDDFGHSAGDVALVAVCRALLSNVRTVDVVARIGGDEFAVLLPETSAAQASALSHRVLAEVAWQGDVLASGLAISIGIAELNTATDLEPGELLVAADDALYQAKAAGGGTGYVAVVPPERGSPPPWRTLDHVTGGSAG
jgi:diguanylate cyclase (GGDEF)-like protein